jgi:hypothetical protein
VSPSGHIVLEKEGDVWYVTSPFRFRAAEYMVTRAVGTGRSLSIGRPVSTNPQKQHLFQVDSAGTLVRFSVKGEERAAIRFGKATTSFTDTYVRLEGSNEVYLARGAHTSSYDRKPEDWKDKGIFRTAQENITGVRFTYGDTTFTLSRNDTIWQVDSDRIGEPTSFLAALSKFEAGGFVDTAIAAPPPLTATIEVNGITMRFYFDKDNDRYYVQTSESSQWYTVPLWKAKQLLKQKADFLMVKPRSA